jgi:hypothetical protein
MMIAWAQREMELDHPPAPPGAPAELAERVAHAWVRSTDHRLLAWMEAGVPYGRCGRPDRAWPGVVRVVPLSWP